MRSTSPPPADPGRWRRTRCPATRRRCRTDCRVTELKNVLQNSLSGSPSDQVGEMPLDLGPQRRADRAFSPSAHLQLATVACMQRSYSSMRSTASCWLPCQSRAAKRSIARRVICAKAGVVAQEGLDHQLRAAHAIQRGFEGVGDLPVRGHGAGRDAPMTVEPTAGSG